MLYLSTIADTSTTTITNAAIAGWRVPTDATAVPYRHLPGANGPADGLVAVDLSTAAVGERLPIVSRPHLLTYGADAVCRLWDVDAEQPYVPIADHEDVYDNAGTLRTVRPGTRISPIAYGEWVNRPGSAAARRSESASNYAPANTIIEYSSVPVDPADALIRSATDEEAITEIFLMCDRLRLCLQGDQWKPESFADDLDPGPDRPRLPFPFHRGPVGGYGIYSLMEGETEDLNYYPRLAGLPIYPTRLNYVKFAQTNGTTDFGKLEEIEFEAALLNPLDLSPRTQVDRVRSRRSGRRRKPARHASLLSRHPHPRLRNFLDPRGDGGRRQLR